MSNGSCASCKRISLTLPSNVLEERPPILSRSGAEPPGEPKFEDKSGTRERASVTHEKQMGSQQKKGKKQDVDTQDRR